MKREVLTVVTAVWSRKSPVISLSCLSVPGNAQTKEMLFIMFAFILWSLITIKLHSPFIRAPLSSETAAAVKWSVGIMWIMNSVSLKQLQSSAFFCTNSSQASGRHVAHYHCVVCSVTIARKTDMISHLKRHVNKGETEASYTWSSEVTFEEPGNKHWRHSCFNSRTSTVRCWSSAAAAAAVS